MTVLALTLVSGLISGDNAADAVRVYVGTYTGKGSQGIYRLILNLADGSLREEGVTEGVANPSFLAIDPSGTHLYCVAEIEDFEGKKTGGVAGFAIDPKTGELTTINAQASGGPGPCHLIVDPAGRNVLVANYGGGSVAVLPIDKNGSLKPASCFHQHQGKSVNPARQERPHAHSINLDANHRFAVVADLGMDKILVYRFDSQEGMLEPNNPPSADVEAGGGPRHFAFHPSGKFAYTNHELTSKVTAFAYDAQQGVLTPLQTISTLPRESEDEDNTTAEIQVHPSGKFLYVSNRGHNSIAVYSIDPMTGTLTTVEFTPTGGAIPRNFGIDPTGRYLLAANQDSNDIVVFHIDPQTGALAPTGHKASVPTPVCIKFLRTDR